MLAQHQVGVRKQKEKQTLALGDLFLQEGSFTLFGFQRRTHLLEFLIGDASPSILILWKENLTLFSLLGASSRITIQLEAWGLQ